MCLVQRSLAHSIPTVHELVKLVMQEMSVHTEAGCDCAKQVVHLRPHLSSMLVSLSALMNAMDSVSPPHFTAVPALHDLVTLAMQQMSVHTEAECDCAKEVAHLRPYFSNVLLSLTALMNAMESVPQHLTTSDCQSVPDGIPSEVWCLGWG